MANKTTFQLDLSAAGRIILQEMAAPVIKQAGDAIAARANSMSSSMSANPARFNVFTTVGTIRRGKRAIATVKATPADSHQSYVAHEAIVKAKDAGRVN